MQKNKYNHTIVQGITSSHKSLIKLIVVAIILALGINLIAGQFIALAIVSPLVTVLFGLVLIFTSLLYLAVNLFGGRVKSHTFEAFIICNSEKNEIVPVPEYDFSEEVHSYIESAFGENPALKTLWKNEPLEDMPFGDQEEISKYKSAQLLLEATQYFLLSELSTHLTDYFNDENFDENNLIKYERKDLPEILLSNRFLELFSRPMEERSAFVEDAFEDDELSCEIVYASGNEGEIYDKFDLVLPKKSFVRKTKHNKIDIETEKLNISMIVKFEGFGTVLPNMFEEYYLGISNPLEHSVYNIEIEIQVLMKLRFLISSTGWKYYHWIDSFLDTIEDKVSKDNFFARNQWDNVRTILYCLDRKQKDDNDQI
ncbi:MAG: hypothetical protein KAT05_10815 [Spirochaetes bacterium]|nr:hypothetical protein [Spirochaetota bacterium]